MFKVGDRVRFLCRYIPHTDAPLPAGAIGVITHVNADRPNAPFDAPFDYAYGVKVIGQHWRYGEATFGYNAGDIHSRDEIMKFKIGDKVRIIVDRVPNTNLSVDANGYGVIVVNDLPHPRGLPYRVAYRDCSGEKRKWYFAEEHLEDAEKIHPLPPPEYDLEDIELAEMIISEINNA